MTYDIRQYILVYPGGWTKGKVSAQVAHASMACITDQFTKEEEGTWWFRPSLETKEWLNGSFAKIVLKANSLQDIYEGFKFKYTTTIPVAMIKDNGATQPDKEAITIAIGPFDASAPVHADVVSWLSQFKLY